MTVAKPKGPDGVEGDADAAAPPRSGRPRGDSAQSIAEAQETTAHAAFDGRPGASRSSAPGSGSDESPGDGPNRDSNDGDSRDGRSGPDDSVTVATGEPGGTPTGGPTRINPKQDATVRRSLALENSGAVTLADNGYRVQQNPTADEVAAARQNTGDVGRPSSDPDYLIEGRVFDCYSPSENKSVRGVWSETEDKILKEQTQRVVVNLEGWAGDMSALRRQFNDWPIANVKEVKAITPDGDIIQLI